MFISRKRRDRELAAVVEYMSMDIEDQLPLTTVATLRLLAGVGDEQDEQIVDAAGSDAVALIARVHELVFAAAANIVEAEAEEAVEDAAA